MKCKFIEYFSSGSHEGYVSVEKINFFCVTQLGDDFVVAAYKDVSNGWDYLVSESFSKEEEARSCLRQIIRNINECDH